MNSLQLVERLTIIRNQITTQSHRDAITDAIAIIESARNDMRPLGHKLAGILDATLPLIDAEAKREESRERGKTMRCITWKGRAAGAREAITKAETVFDYLP